MPASLKSYQPNGAVLDLLAPRLSMLTRIDLANDPLSSGVAQKEPDEVNGVGGVDQETRSRVAECLDRDHLSHPAACYHLVRSDVLPVETPLVPDQEQGAAGLTGFDHFIGRFQVERDGLLAQDGTRRRDGGGLDGHRGMKLVMRTDTDDVRTFDHKHLAVVLVPSRDTELASKAPGRLA